MAPRDVVIVERSHMFGKPEYCIHGETLCLRCTRGCWLGSETIKMVENGAAPLCIECANELTELGQFPAKSEATVTRVNDHLRKDGPHS